jgi:hypothetical protein
MPFADPDRGRAYQREYWRTRRSGDSCTTPVPLPFRHAQGELFDFVNEKCE